jgi:meiotically up-regulated gene 157 (Mug157) protein
LCIVLCNKTCKYNVSSLQCRTIKLTYMFWQGSQSDIQNV